MAALDLLVRLCSQPAAPIVGSSANDRELSTLLELGLVRQDGSANFLLCPHCDPPEMAPVHAGIDGFALECPSHGTTTVLSSDVALHRLDLEALINWIRDATHARLVGASTSGPVSSIGTIDVATDLAARVFFSPKLNSAHELSAEIAAVPKPGRRSRDVLIVGSISPVLAPVTSCDPHIVIALLSAVAEIDADEGLRIDRNTLAAYADPTIAATPARPGPPGKVASMIETVVDQLWASGAVPPVQRPSPQSVLNAWRSVHGNAKLPDVDYCRRVIRKYMQQRHGSSLNQS